MEARRIRNLNRPGADAGFKVSIRQKIGPGASENPSGQKKEREIQDAGVRMTLDELMFC